DIELVAGNPLRIKLVDQHGEPVSGAYVGIGRWRGTEAIYNEKHPNVPDSGIPRHADEKGVYAWDWAPEDAVVYRISAKGFAAQEPALTAKSTPHVITMAPTRVAIGRVTDASSGQPIEQFQAMPVIVFGPDFYSTSSSNATAGSEGRYELPLIGSGPDVRYRVRFEAVGYRSLVSEESFGPLDGRATLDVALEPAPARTGRVVDITGRPVENATVWEASPTMVPMVTNAKPNSYGGRPRRTDAQGEFAFPATTEPVLLRVYDDRGFAEKRVAVDEEFGVLELQPWATISGRLTQAGIAIGGESIFFYPTLEGKLTEPRFQDTYHAQTESDGYFRFDRLPPASGSLKAYLGPWRESPLTSSEAVPIRLAPAEQRQVVLGGEGATIAGRVIATGRDNESMSKQWSLNYLISRDRGVDYPSEGKPLGFDGVGPLQLAWLRHDDFQSWLSTRLRYFVKLSDDGRLRIHGVPPGEYDLAIQLYEEPAGCLVETIGEKIVPITVTEEQATATEMILEDIEVKCRVGPRVGSDMRAFEFTDASGRRRHVNDLKGRYVVLHAWATWCAPCLASMPTLQTTVEEHADAPLTFVGLNVDEDKTAARALAERKNWNWAHNYLGADSALMRQLAVSSVPAYYLIGPDGKLVGSSNQWKSCEEMLRAAFE
ncbi:MAG: redoxin domain-containing protein, partial [Planctomycetota bacterium]